MAKKIVVLMVFNGLLLTTIGILFIAFYQSSNMFDFDTKKQNFKTQQDEPAIIVPKNTKLQTVSLFFVKLDDIGKSGKLIGCNDSLIKVTKTSSSTDLKKTLAELFSIKTSTYDKGLYNSLYQSTITVNNVQIKDGVAIVELTGKYYVGGVCDGPRFISQIKETVLNYEGVHESKITVNKLPLESLFSGKGE